MKSDHGRVFGILKFGPRWQLSLWSGLQTNKEKSLEDKENVPELKCATGAGHLLFVEDCALAPNKRFSILFDLCEEETLHYEYTKIINETSCGY